MSRFTSFASFVAVLIVAAAAFGGSGAWPPEVEHALELAGANRAELERVLAHYEVSGDAQKLDAAEFLIGNMEGHGYVEHGFFDEDDNEIAFDALEHKNFKQAQKAMDALEAEHGPIHYGRKRFVSDLETITADFLIENIDLAFAQWRERPWARDVSFEVFCEYILPYRGSNEPLDAWRSVCIERFADVTATLDDPEDLRAAGNAVLGPSRGWVRFSTLYYLHPTDQGFGEMLESKTGRCEDMSNMMGFACRANGLPMAQDYTPFWANRDNNHAWEVLLDAEGRGRAGLSNKAAKVYRKTYSAQPAALGTVKADDESVPRWLARKTYKDVTTDYLETTDVTVDLTAPVPDGQRFAYLCVFNGGEWQAIHWGAIESGADGDRVTFTKMGRGIAYLPAYYVDEALVPAAAPLILRRDGAVQTLDGSASATIRVDLASAKAETDHLTIKLKPGTRHELFVWDDGWQSLGSHDIREGTTVRMDAVPAGRLYWLVRDGSRRLERVFTVEEGARRGW